MKHNMRPGHKCGCIQTLLMPRPLFSCGQRRTDIIIEKKDMKR